ncbi:MAG: thioredoxin domain-containing protein [Gammaproteobacteria bacterium]|nr:thioredoxin domain-containing protein [Gammaproteobacteria bacterium]
MKQTNLVIIAVVLIVGAFAIGTFLYTSQQNQSQQGLVKDNADALIKPHSFRTGNPKAKVTIVEFMDPACETCKHFHPFVKDLMSKNRGKVKLVIRYAPFHQGSDYMVAILEAARKQRKFKQVLDLMFETQSTWASHHKPDPQAFWDVLQRNGFDIASLQMDMTDPAIRKVIDQDLADGARLGANKTPTFFVNGKPLPSFGYEQLRDLVNAEVAANY